MKKNKLKTVNWRITEACNLRCSNCNYWRINPPIETPFKVIPSIIREFAQLGVQSLRLNGGEPTLHPNLSEIIAIANNFNIKVQIATNGFSVSDEIINSLIANNRNSISISLDSNIEYIHDKLRGRQGSFKKIEHLLKILAVSEIYVSLNVLVCSSNYSESFLKDLVEYSKRFHVGYISFSLIDHNSPYKNMNKNNLSNSTLFLTKNQFDNYIKSIHNIKKSYLNSNITIDFNPDYLLASNFSVDKLYKLYIKGLLGAHFYKNNKCFESQNGINIQPDGWCYPCLSTIDMEEYRLGNINKDNIETILNSQSRKKYIERREKGPLRTCLACKDHHNKNYTISKNNE